MARHGRSLWERAPGLRRGALAVTFLLVVALVPALLLHRDDPAPTPPRAATAPTTTAPTTTAAPSTTAAPTTTPAPSRTTPRPRPSPTPRPTGVRLPVTAPVPTGPVPPRTAYQEFPSVCGPAGPGREDGVPGQFFGVAPGAGTSCLYGTDRSTYWVPDLRQAGTVIRPERAEVYYKSGIRNYNLVRPFPTGFTLRSGTAAQAQAAGAFASWSCGQGDALTFPTSCPAGSRMVLRLQAPSCWDGQRLDSADSRAHLAWPLDDRCPGGHPVPVPKLEMVVFYPLPAGALRLSVATGAPSSVVFRFTDGWTPAAEAELVAGCVDRGRRCDETGVDPDHP
jgi:Domain of unknown function (DUF1996)